MMTGNAHRQIGNQQGLTLIEVLVTVLILAIGMLGLAALQLNSLKVANDSDKRYLAALHTFDMAERMRANLGEARLGDTYKDVANASTCSGTCTSVEVAEDDLAVWLAALAADLPNGSGAITWVNNMGVESGNLHGVYEMTVTWDEKDTYDGDGDGVTDETLPQTYKMKVFF